jgi:hypothetical protein
MPLETVLPRLNSASVENHYGAFDDIDWDSPDLALDPDDPRLELFDFDPLAGTGWYRGLPAGTRSRLGMHRLASAMTVGWQFENLLQRGLLDYSMRHHADADVFRYLQHEIAEEAQHTMVFREYTRRAGFEASGMPAGLRWLARTYVVPMNRYFPELFFVFVLGGEDPADYLQRRQLASGTIHPLLARIFHIHITEESRHLSFARTYLQDRAASLGPAHRAYLSAHAPVVLGIMARMIIYPAPDLVRRYEIPKPVLRSAYDTPAGREILAASVAKPRRLLQRLGLVPDWSVPIWRRYDIWPGSSG